MMSDPRPTELDELDLELVAYLDGETDAETSRRLEQLVAQDPQARARLRALEQAWDALDELPRARATERFTTSTVEMIALSESDLAETEGTRARVRYVAQALLAGLMLLAIGTAGYAVGTSLATRENRQLLEHLPLIERLDQFQQIDDVEYLRQLHDQRIFPGTAVERTQ